MNEKQQLSLWKSKKGYNDMYLLSLVLGVFLLTAVLLPLIQSSFGTSQSRFDNDAFRQDVQEGSKSLTNLNAFTVFSTVFKLAFWDFGDTLDLPVWVDAFYTLLAVLTTLIVARNIWIGGGG